MKNYKSVVFMLLVIPCMSLVFGTILFDMHKTVEEHKLVIKKLESEDQLKSEKMVELNKTNNEERKVVEDLEKLIKTLNRDLKLIYTFAKTGIQAETIDEVRKLLDLASNLPIGSPFKGDFTVTSPFGARNEEEWGGDGRHFGIDIIPKTGNSRAEIFTTASGKIIEFGVSDTYGKYIIYETDFGYRMKYAHLSTIFYQADDGQVKDIHLEKNVRIGRMGDTGFSFGAHLHLEIHIWNELLQEYQQLDPEEILYYIDNEE